MTVRVRMSSGLEITFGYALPLLFLALPSPSTSISPLHLQFHLLVLSFSPSFPSLPAIMCLVGLKPYSINPAPSLNQLLPFFAVRPDIKPVQQCLKPDPA